MKEQELKAIEQLMIEKNKNRSDIARCWSRDPAAVTNFFNGKKQLKIDELDQLAELFEMTPLSFLARIRGQSLEPWNDAIFKLASEKAIEAVQAADVKLGPNDYADFVYLLYKHALSEMRAEGQVTLTKATVNLLLRQKLSFL